MSKHALKRSYTSSRELVSIVVEPSSEPEKLNTDKIPSKIYYFPT